MPKIVAIFKLQALPLACAAMYLSLVQDRKRQFEIVKLERDFMRQKNVLRRKTEEAAASSRRWKELLEKQKNAATKRMQSQSKTLDSANTKMKVGCLGNY